MAFNLENCIIGPVKGESRVCFHGELHCNLPRLNFEYRYVIWNDLFWYRITDPRYEKKMDFLPGHQATPQFIIRTS